MAVREYFWGSELTEAKKTAVWDPEAEDKDLENESSGITHFLFLKQATLGAKAKDGQRNLIEIEAEDFDGNTIKQPLFSLKLGQNESTVLDIGAQPPLTLRLVEGSGPVFVSGQHALELNEDDMDMFDDEADEAEESPMVQKKAQAKKRPASSTDGPAKKAKLNNTDSKKKAPLDEDDSDSEDDEDFNPDAPEDSDEEDESDEEEDENDSEMEEGTPEKTKKADKAQTNGAGPKKAKTKGDAEPKSLDKIKQELKKSPSKPKKRNKFANFVKTQYKLTDDKAVDELWTWYKDSIIST